MYGYQFVYFYEQVNTKVKGEFFNNGFIFKNDSLLLTRE